jgi:RNA polymerase sigma-B factor
MRDAQHGGVHPAAHPAVDLVGELPLVRALARRYCRGGDGYEDLVQVAALGLVAAARRFDPGRGVPFQAYAVATIEGELKRHLRDRVAAVRVPRGERARAVALQRAAAAAAQRLGREPSLSEAADAAGVSPREAESVLQGTRTPASLAILEQSPSAEAEAAIESCERRAVVDELLRALDPRERTVVQLRFGADLPQSEIAGRLGLSQSAVSRLLTRALAKLRASAGPDVRACA